MSVLVVHQDHRERQGREGKVEPPASVDFLVTTEFQGTSERRGALVCRVSQEDQEPLEEMDLMVPGGGKGMQALLVPLVPPGIRVTQDSRAPRVSMAPLGAQEQMESLGHLEHKEGGAPG